MSKAQHTPGPYRVDPRAATRVVAGEDDTVATTGCQADLRDHWEANANLFAAAPDMLAAGIEIDRLMLVIESAVRNDDKSHHAKVLAALKANRAAIAEAKVET